MHLVLHAFEMTFRYGTGYYLEGLYRTVYTYGKDQIIDVYDRIEFRNECK